MNAAAQPEFREEEVEETEQVGDARTVRYQGIHVGRLVFELPPGVAVKVTSQPADYRCREYPGNVVGVWQVHQEHADDDDGDTQDNGPGGTELQLTVT